MLSAVRTAYAWLLLTVIMLPLFPTMLVAGPLLLRRDPRGDQLRRFIASWVSLYARLTPLYRFTIERTEHVPKEGPYVLVANHESGLDVLALLLLRLPVRFLAETWMFRIPLAGWLFRMCRHIPVRPGDRESGRRALEAAEAALDEGTPVAMFPEGKLSPDGLAELKPGAFVLASRRGVPLIPVLLEGTGRAWRPGSVVVRGVNDIRVAVLAPILPADATDPDELRARTRRAIEAARTSDRSHAATAS